MLIDQDISGFEIAMYDQLAMGKLNGLNHLQKQLQPGFGIKRMIFHVLIDGGAAHQFHDQVGSFIITNTPIKNPGNTWVIQTRQNLALLLESLTIAIINHAGIKQFDGDLLLKLTIIALGQVNIGHATRADQLTETVDPQASADQGLRIRQVGVWRDGATACYQKSIPLVV
jgi:hypothetical protein